MNVLRWKMQSVKIDLPKWCIIVICCSLWLNISNNGSFRLNHTNFSACRQINVSHVARNCYCGFACFLFVCPWKFVLLSNTLHLSRRIFYSKCHLLLLRNCICSTDKSSFYSFINLNMFSYRSLSLHRFSIAFANFAVNPKQPKAFFP